MGIEIEYIRVENFLGAKNQFLIHGNNWVGFQSYDSPIAVKRFGKIYIFPDWDYSVTTGKYRNAFLGEVKAETEKKIKNGTYKMVKSYSEVVD